ncbi:MAG: hypothetical protein ACUZ8H_03645 [Candidatus Anammoxibacter sp.]
MLTNHLLKEKEHVQKKLYDEAGHDLKKYVEKTDEIVKETEKKYSLNFNYSIRKVECKI